MESGIDFIVLRGKPGFQKSEFLVYQLHEKPSFFGETLLFLVGQGITITQWRVIRYQHCESALIWAYRILHRTSERQAGLYIDSTLTIKRFHNPSFQAGMLNHKNSQITNTLKTHVPVAVEIFFD